jgi:transposase InsO family protein
VDTYCKVAHAKLYTTKTPITAADPLNDRVLPFHDEYDLPMLRIMTDRGTEFCGRADKHDFQLFLAINDIDHTKTKVKSPQTNGICERFHKTVLQEFYQVAFRKKLYDSIDTLQSDVLSCFGDPRFVPVDDYVQTARGHGLEVLKHLVAVPG